METYLDKINMGKTLVKVELPVRDAAQVMHSKLSGTPGLNHLHRAIELHRGFVLGEYVDVLTLCMNLTQEPSE
jgi:hypothetical protein